MKIVTYNIKNYSKSHPFKKRRRELLDNVRGCDVICLQELVPASIIYLWWSLLRTHRMCWAFNTAIFVSRKHKVIHSKRVRLFGSWGAVLRDLDLFRYASVATVLEDGVGRVYDVASVHFGFRDEWEENLVIFSDFWSDFVMARSIVAGDFNVGCVSGKYRLLKSIFGIDDNKGEHKTFHGWRGDAAQETTIDFIFRDFVADDVSTYSVRSNASDHYPLYLTF